MSKNVAVFVDVANIFYAAKAAGVDIDYVTLLKSATAGRDFVRAYAYTGLDPENENQRQFHSFLARSGYKVVSKDIRKYGDGRIKANLDIELVVDLMRMAEHLDIAVVVSGDGDFAPAIRAVQQMGVRVEVVSFRGNTSSDLIEVADVFLDIGQIARVEKGERSGRRVAAEGDLSMTEVPDKEAGVTPRRRRGRRGEPEEHPVRPARPDEPAAPAASPAGLVALPGERLSRVSVEQPQVAPDVEEGARPPVGPLAAEGPELTAGDRRRRRRGGRGRGRGGRPSEQPVVAAAGLGPESDLPEAPQYADEVPTLPQHSTFGSVWDSQIGMPVSSGRPLATPASASSRAADVETLEDEPEVPEYLLAERRQQGRRPGGRGRTGRAGGGYRSAIDRERYGPSGAPGGFQGGGRPMPGPRPSGPSRRAPEPPVAPRPAPSAEPWSEVPPEVQELLRAEVARRRPGAAPVAPAATQTTEAKGTRVARPARRRAASGPIVEGSDVPAPEVPLPEAVAAPSGAEPEASAMPPRRTARRRAGAEPSEAAVSPTETDSAEAKPRRTPRRRVSTPSEAEEPAAETSAATPASEAKPKRTPRRRTTADPDAASS